MIRTAAVWAVHLVSSLCRALGWRACRFHPSCSEYSVSSFHRFSWPAALGLSLRRLLRCHPFSRGGFDPVPEKES